MGMYLNPGNDGFTEAIRTDYVDKTGMLALINRTINTKKKLTCISRPRRFGKSYAARMLCAYYDCTCDSHDLFNERNISKDSSYEEHINKYQVIYLDMSNLLGKARPEQLVQFIKDNVEAEILNSYPDVKKKNPGKIGPRNRCRWMKMDKWFIASWKTLTKTIISWMSSLAW